MKISFIILLIFLITGCSNVNLTYMDNKSLMNPIYEKTRISTTGLDLNFMNSYLPMIFGLNKKNEFLLSIDINERKTKRSVESNQAVSNLSYELRFTYSLYSNTNECVTLERKILSNFSIIPKSDGYNYGTDASLDKKYELAVSENLNRFLSYLSDSNVNVCL